MSQEDPVIIDSSSEFTPKSTPALSVASLAPSSIPSPFANIIARPPSYTPNPPPAKPTEAIRRRRTA